MNTTVTTLYRDVTCGAAAAVITLILSAAFVQSTSVPPGMHATATHFVAMQPKNAWFGQPEPAVLVD
jgi:hypothetical protein